MATTTHRRATEEDLLKQPKDGRKYELVDGELRVTPAGFRHDEVALRLGARLAEVVYPNALGRLAGSSAGFRLPSGNVRSPDVSFVARGRFPEERSPEGFSPVAPDLAVEVVSPEDRSRDVLDKVGEYLDAGVRLVWVIDPRKAKASVYRSLTDVREVGSDGELDGEDVVPGFRCRLAAILEP